MRSFRLHVGEGKHLTGAGCVCVLVALAATACAGYLFADDLADDLGPGRLMIAVVAVCGGAVGVIAAVAFRAAGVTLVATDTPDTKPPS